MGGMSQRRWVCRWRATWAAGPANTPVCLLLQAGDGPLTPHRGCPWARVPRDHGVHPHGCGLCRRPLTKHVFYRDGGEPLRPSASPRLGGVGALTLLTAVTTVTAAVSGGFPPSAAGTLPRGVLAVLSRPPAGRPRCRRPRPCGCVRSRDPPASHGVCPRATLSPGRPSPRRSLCRNVQPFLG